MISTSEHPLAGSLRQINVLAGPRSPALDPAPEIGRDTDVVIADLGYSEKVIAALHREGVI